MDPAEQETMEVTEQVAEEPGTSAQAQPAVRPAAKRMNVDFNDKEVPDSKRNKAVPDANGKLQVQMLLFHWHEYLKVVFGVKENTNIDLIADLTSIIQTIHNKMRQDSNGVGSLKDFVTDDLEFECNGNKVKYGSIKGNMRKLANEYGITYGKTDDDRKRTGTLSSILVLITCFRARFNEVRLGNSSFLLKRVNGVDHNVELSAMNLTNTHSILLTGCRYTPSLQSSMKQSLGPMTIVMNLVMNTDNRYIPSWKAAFCQAFKLIRGHSEIADLLAGSRNRYKGIVRQLADIALFGVTRTSNKAFIPMALLMTYNAIKNAGYRERFRAGRQFVLTPIDRDMLDPLIINLDFSGHGLLHFWNALNTIEFSMRGDGATFKPEYASQMLFHAVFGSHKENLELLTWMTGHQFNTRRQIGAVLQKRGESGKTVKAQIIPFRYFAKLVSAAQTDFLRGGVGQIARAPTFSGRFDTEVAPNNELFKALVATPGALGVPNPTGEAEIALQLDQIKKEIATRLTKDGAISYGTTDFYEPLAGGDGTAYGPKVAAPGRLATRYFYQQE